MPRYDFVCSHCDRLFTTVVSCTESRALCECGELADKQFPAPNFSIKGYTAKTGYATKEARDKD